MATRTCEGSTVPAVQADPLDAAIPAKSKLTSMASTFVPGKLMFNTCGRDVSRIRLFETQHCFALKCCTSISLYFYIVHFLTFVRSEQFLQLPKSPQ